MVNLKAGSPWPMFGHDRARRGLSTFSGAQSPGIKWSVSINAPAYLGALTVDDDGTIYVPGGVNQPGGVNKLLAVNPDGTTKWSIPTGNLSGFDNPPLIGADGTLYQTSSTAVLRALAPANGSTIWTFAGISGDPARRSDGAIMGTYTGLIAVTPQGQLIWNHPLLPAIHIFLAPAVAADGTTYTSSAGQFVAVAADGSTRWQQPWGTDTATIGTDGTVYVMNGTTLHALNPDGCELWKTPLDFRPGGYFNSQSIGPDGTIYASGSSGLYAVSPVDGAVKWSYTVANSLSPRALAIGADGTVYASIDGLLAFAPDGNQLWSFAGQCGSPAIGTGGTTLVVCGGKLYAFGAGAPISDPLGSSAAGSPTLDCSGAGPGSAVWTTIIPRPFLIAPPLPQQPPPGFQAATVAGFGVGSTGHAFVTMASQPSIPDPIITLDELDSPGVYLGTRFILGDHTPLTTSLEVFGAGEYVVGGIGSNTASLHPGSDVVSPTLRHSLASRTIGSPAVSITGTSNAAGEIFERRPDTISAVSLRKWTAEGAPVWNAPLLPLGTPFHNGCDVSSLRADDAGAAYVAGQAEGTCFCGLAAAFFVAKLDLAGQCLWAQPLFTKPTAAFRSIPTTGGVYVTDAFTGTADVGCGPMTSPAPKSVYLARLDAAGACLWSKSYDVAKLGVTLFPGGDLLLSAVANGESLGGAPLSGGGFALARLDASGVHQWSEAIGNPGLTYVGAGVARTDPTGNIVLSGPTIFSVDFGGGVLLNPTPSSRYSYVVKLDGAGAFLWQSAQLDATLTASDGCGAVLAAATCDQCAPGNASGVRVVKLAP